MSSTTILHQSSVFGYAMLVMSVGLSCITYSPIVHDVLVLRGGQAGLVIGYFCNAIASITAFWMAELPRAVPGVTAGNDCIKSLRSSGVHCLAGRCRKAARLATARSRHRLSFRQAWTSKAPIRTNNPGYCWSATATELASPRPHSLSCEARMPLCKSPPLCA